MLMSSSLNLVNGILVMLVYVVTSVSGLTLIKTAPTMWSLPFLSGGVLYGGGFLIWIFLILRIFPLSFGFPVSAGALIIATQISGYFFMNENFSLNHLFGIALILVGIIVLFASGEFS